MKNEIMRMDRVTLIEDEVTLLDDFNLHIFQGEIMGLVCINSDGQDALVNLICQNIPIHYGYIYFDEKLVNSYRHSSMEPNRVSVIEEKSHMAEALSVADNIFVLRRGFKKYLISPRILRAQLSLFTQELDVAIDADEAAGKLTHFQRCVAELLKAVINGVKLVVLRDISNFLGPADLNHFLKLLRHYSKEGLSFLYICNHHEETFRICDRVALLENGRVRKLLFKEDFRDEIVLHYALDFRHSLAPPAGSDPRTGMLKFRRLFTDHIHDMNCTIEEGECAVLLDSNSLVLNDLAALMTGDLFPQAGKILLSARDWCSNHKRLKHAVSFVRENPIESMLFSEMSYLDNLCFSLDWRFPTLWMSRRIKRSILREYEPLIGKDIHAQDITHLSPYSLYNLVYYRIHLYHPKVVFLMQPFAGADMYLRRHLIHLINQLRERKITVGILAVSLSDSLLVADRLLMFEDGHLRIEYLRDEFHLLSYAPCRSLLPPSEKQADLKPLSEPFFDMQAFYP